MTNIAQCLTVLVLAVACGCLSVRGTVVHSHGGGHTGYLRHLVLFKFNPDATPGQRIAVENAFRDMQHTIPHIHAFEWGTDISGRGLNKGFTHGGLFTFENETGRDAYRDHPVHRDFVALVSPLVEEIFVFDYWAE